MAASESTMNRLTSTRLLAKNSLLNLLGQVLPLAVALFAIPHLIEVLGKERFGVFAITWAVLGYFGLFDLGLGRVLTIMISEKLGKEQHDQVRPILKTGLIFMAIIGLFSMILVFVLSPTLVYKALKIPLDLQPESIRALTILALALPFVTMTAGLHGVLQAYQKFGVINLIRTVNGSYTFLAPLLIAQWSIDLAVLVLGLAIGRVLVNLVYFIAVFKVVPPGKGLVNVKFVLSMFKLGGWISVSNIIGPIMVYFDRFLIGVWISMTAVSFYVTPYEVVTKLLIIPGALANVLFPALSTSYNVDAERTEILYSRGLRLVLVLFFPIVFTLFCFAEPAILLWLGEDFAQKSTSVLHALAIGVFFNAPGQMALSFIQAAGRPDLTAKLHLCEAPFYILLLWFLATSMGITGVAIAWSIRIVFDSLILLLIVQVVLKKRYPVFKIISLSLSLILILFLGGLFLSTTAMLIYYSVAILSFAGYAVHYLLTRQEKGFFLQKVHRFQKA